MASTSKVIKSKIIEKRCKFCYSNKVVYWFQKGDTVLLGCKECGIVYCDGELSGPEMQSLYNYYEAEFSQTIDPVLESRYISLLKRFAEYKKNGMLLDVGCGRGYFVDTANRLGWKAIGLEFSDAAYKKLSTKGLNVILGSLDETKFQDNFFDVVTLFEVIEHLSDPLATLKQVYRILRPGGLLYITTPNFNSLSRVLLKSSWRTIHKEHRFYFNAEALGRLLNNFGFINLKIITKNISLGELRKCLSIKKSNPVESRMFDNNLNMAVEHSKGLSFLKDVVNLFLRISGKGDTIYAIAEKS